MSQRVNINDLELGARARNALHYFDYQFIDQIPANFFEQIKPLKNFGKATIIEIAAELPSQHPAIANAESLFPDLQDQISSLKAKKQDKMLLLVDQLRTVYRMRHGGASYKEIGEFFAVSGSQAKLLFQKAEKLIAKDSNLMPT